MSIALISCILLQTSYLPLPIKVRKDTDTPFPCQDSHCSCRNAEECWESCQCHTLTEKIAFAEEHGQEIPDWAIVESQRDASAKESSECECCQGTASASFHATLARPTTEKRVPLVIGRARKCQGKSLDISQGFVYLLVEQEAGWPQPTLEWGHVASDVFTGIDPNPPIPPPKIEAAV